VIKVIWLNIRYVRNAASETSTWDRKLECCSLCRWTMFALFLPVSSKSITFYTKVEQRQIKASRQIIYPCISRLRETGKDFRRVLHHEGKLFLMLFLNKLLCFWFRLPDFLSFSPYSTPACIYNHFQFGLWVIVLFCRCKKIFTGSTKYPGNNRVKNNNKFVS